MREEKRERIDREERLVAKLSLRSTPAQLSTAPDRTALAIAAAFDVSEKTKGSERSQWQVKQKSSQQLRRQSREHRSSLVGKAEKTTQPAPRQRSPRSSVRAPRSSLLAPLHPSSPPYTAWKCSEQQRTRRDTLTVRLGNPHPLVRHRLNRGCQRPRVIPNHLRNTNNAAHAPSTCHQRHQQTARAAFSRK